MSGDRSSLLGAIAAPANRHDSPLLDDTLDTLEVLGELLERVSAHLDRGYDSQTTHDKLQTRERLAEISEKGKPAPTGGHQTSYVERTNSWNNAHNKLAWCTERQDQSIDFWIAFSGVLIIVGRLVRQAWTL